jgi:hypothetical protein
MSRENKERKRQNRRQKSEYRHTSLPATSPRVPPPAKREVVLLSYQIAYDQLPTVEPANLPMELIDEDTRARTFDLLHKDPKQAIELISGLLEQHPNTPTLLNWLFAANQSLGQNAECARIAQTNYEQNPDYLFARLGYAEILLERGELDKIPDVFKGGYDLKAMYPDRDVFHVTELTAMCHFMIRFMVRKNQPEQARPYLTILKKMAPHHPATRAGENLLEGSSLKRMAQMLAARMLRRGELPG